MDFKEIKQIVELMNKNELSYFQLEKDDFVLKLKKGSDMEAVQEVLRALPSGGISGGAIASAAPAIETSSPAPKEAPAPAEDPNAPPAGTEEIRSPMVGTFYRSPNPESDPFVKVGQEIDEDTVLCTIEAMKTFNEIKAEKRGTIVKILVDNGQPVQYEEPLFLIKPA